MSTLHGGWTVHDPVTEEDKQILTTALHGLEGVDYDPIAVASQVVNGINYIFIAKATPVTLNPVTGLAKIYVSAVPAGSEPTLVNIERII